jgi:tetratricopeptide (TPR) repeat protein
VDRPELKLAPPPRASSRAPAVWGALVLAAGLGGTLAGADRARAPLDAAALAERGVLAWLSGDDAAAEARRADLRRRLDRTPTDATTRSVYASLLAETATTPEERARAAQESRRSVRAAPHDEGVRRAAIKVMARTGDPAGAASEVRALFAEAPDHAALVLSEIEPFLTPDALAAAVPDLPAAWLARSLRLRMDERTAEADRLLGSLVTRWPGDLRARQLAGQVAASRGDDEAVSRLVPADLPLPEDRGHAALLALRSRSRARGGDVEGARRDAERATALAPDDPWIATAAGDALENVDADAARSYWTQALYRHPRDEGTRQARIATLARLARLAEREGRAPEALRRWREVLEIDERNAEAARRVTAIAGGAWPPGTPPR